MQLVQWPYSEQVFISTGIYQPGQIPGQEHLLVDTPAAAKANMNCEISSLSKAICAIVVDYLLQDQIMGIC